ADDWVKSAKELSSSLEAIAIWIGQIREYIDKIEKALLAVVPDNDEEDCQGPDDEAQSLEKRALETLGLLKRKLAQLYQLKRTIRERHQQQLSSGRSPPVCSKQL